MKVFKKIMAACLAGVAAMSMAVTASADMAEKVEFSALAVKDSIAAQAYKEGFSLVSEEEFNDEDDENIFYCVRLFKRSETDESSVMSTNATTTDTYFLDCIAGVKVWPMKEKQDWAYMWVTGSFEYDGNTCRVSKEDGDANSASPGLIIVDNPKAEGKSNQGSNFLLGNKYAIVSKDVTMTNGFNNNRQKFHLSLDVNCKGEPHTDPKGLIPEKID